MATMHRWRLQANVEGGKCVLKRQTCFQDTVLGVRPNLLSHLLLLSSEHMDHVPRTERRATPRKEETAPNTLPLPHVADLPPCN